MVAKSVQGTTVQNPGISDSIPNVNTNQQWFLMVSKWCSSSSIHSIILIGEVRLSLCTPHGHFGTNEKSMGLAVLIRQCLS